MHGIDSNTFAFSHHLSLQAVSIISLLAFCGFAFASVRRLKTMDVP
jgi:hypothetical protein